MGQQPSAGLFAAYFDDALSGAPYRDAGERLMDDLSLVDLYLCCATLARGGEGAFLQPVGFSCPPERAADLLRAARLPQRNARLGKPLADDLRRAWVRLALREAASPPPKTPFGGLFASLGRFDRLALLLAAAARCDRKYEGLFASLQGAGGEPLLGLCCGLYSLADPLEPAHWADFFDRFPNTLLYHSPNGDRGQSAALCLRQPALRAMLGELPAPASGPFFTVIPAEGSRRLPEMVCGGALLEAVCDTAAARGERGLLLQLWGAPGSGRLYTVRQAAKRFGWDLLAVHCPLLAALEGERLLEAVGECACACLLGGFVPVLEEPDRMDPPRARLLLDGLARCGVVFLLSQTPALPAPAPGFDLVRFAVELPAPRERIPLWQSLAKEGGFSGGIDFTAVGGKYRLNPGQTEAALRAASLLARGRGRPAGEQEIAEAVAMQGQGALSRQCTRIRPIFTFDDLILSETTKAQLRHVFDRVQHSYRVNVGWGFDRKFAYGKGVSVLLYGLPGTGKTMCAQVLAGELRLELYKVDLGSLVSKYVGETEKHLSELFTEAEKANAILFFDEADALFSKRTADAQGSNDKYANMETSHLLQKMEEYSGVTILATNLAGNFDKAFYRRMSYVISIPFPDRQTRRRLWERAFPAGCPVAGDVDFALLARQFELSPSTIKSVALEAAFRAAGAGEDAVGMRRIVGALAAELVKEGKTLGPQELLGFDREL